MRVLFVVLMLFTLPVAAQELAPKYKVIGQMELMIDGKDVVLHVVTIPVESRSYATQEVFMGSRVLSVKGISVDQNGRGGPPFVNLVIGLPSFETPSLAVVDYIEPNGSFKHPITARAEYGIREMTNFSYSDDGELELDFIAALVRTVLDDNYNQSLEKGGETILITGHVSVVIPDKYRTEE